jgi:hypothetical protein
MTVSYLQEQRHRQRGAANPLAANPRRAGHFRRQWQVMG